MLSLLYISYYSKLCICSAGHVTGFSVGLTCFAVAAGENEYNKLHASSVCADALSHAHQL